MKWKEIPTPAYVLDEGKLIRNLTILHSVAEDAGCKILLAQKAFSMYRTYPLLADYLSGTTASGIYEARLGHEEMGGETHVFEPAYKPEEMEELCEICDHIVFNSCTQYETHVATCKGKALLGLRLNPEHSTQDHAIYDPCAPGSRLGITRDALQRALDAGLDLSHVTGFHMHTLCEQNADALEETVLALEEKFGSFLQDSRITWLNLGGGHHITREDYDRERLIRLIQRLKRTYGVEVYLEPGEAVAYYAGYLVTEVLDIVDNGGKILILDASAACHMPDVLEMPYRPPLKDSALPGKKPYTYRLASRTCLAGDVIGDYAFDREIQIGDRLVFEDMAIYTMVKNNTFNGMPLPAIAWLNTDGDVELIKEFGYEDYKMRL